MHLWFLQGTIQTLADAPSVGTHGRASLPASCPPTKRLRAVLGRENTWAATKYSLLLLPEALRQSGERSGKGDGHSDVTVQEEPPPPGSSLLMLEAALRSPHN